MDIKQIKAREILDSRGFPTIEAEIILSSGTKGRASVPSGASTGIYEAAELRDGGTRYAGKGVTQAISNIQNHIAPILKGKKASEQRHIDELMLGLDGTNNKTQLGANAILAVSLATAKAAALEQKLPLWQYVGLLAGQEPKYMPRPMMNILNGGAHANNNIDIQEFMIIPKGADSISQALQMGAEIFHQLKKILSANGQATTLGDEGGFAPNLKNTQEALDVILQAIDKAGYKAGRDPNCDVALALDVASSELYKDEKTDKKKDERRDKRKDKIYDLRGEGMSLTAKEMISYYETLCKSYPIISIEDGLAEQDYQGWRMLTAQLGDKLQLVGDDLFVTNTKLLEKGIDEKLANAILIKPNQIGSLTETLETIAMAQKAGFSCIMSHRSGETEDTTIADLSVGTNCRQIKTGSLARGERTCKYNQLLRIEEELGAKAVFGC